MTTSRRPRILVACTLALALAASVVLVGATLAGGSGGKRPDLFPSLPSAHSNVNSRWIDTVEVPGQVLFRFDTVIHNKAGAGALDVYRPALAPGQSPTAVEMRQLLWTNVAGAPPADVRDDTPLPTSDVIERVITGKAITYSSAKGHHHFHAPLVARYSLHRGDGGLISEATKNAAGFCLYDSWGDGGTRRYWDGAICRPGQSSYRGVVRMGISPGYGDFYGSQLGDQWINVTGATPGNYTLRAEVDPASIYGEESAARANNVLTTTVTIPGAVVNAPQTLAVGHGGSGQLQLAGTVVGSGVKSRPDDPNCDTGNSCVMTTAVPGKIHYTLVPGSAPAADVGSVSVSDSGLVRFTAAPGFAGPVEFAVRGVDSRGLGGAPVPVHVNVAGAPVVTLTVNPLSAELETGESRQFTATLTGASGPLEWSVDNIVGGNETVGTVDGAGRYTAPAAAPAHGLVTVRVRHAASGRSASAQVTVTQAPVDPEITIGITPGSVELMPGEAHQFVAASSGVTDPLTWSVEGIVGGNAEVGTIDQSGFYRAPAGFREGGLVIRATDEASGQFAQAYVVLQGGLTPVEPEPTTPTDPPAPPAPTPGGNTPPVPPIATPPKAPPTKGGRINEAPTRPTKATVRLRPRYTLIERRGRVFLRVTGAVSASHATRKVAIQRRVGRRMVTISRPRVNARGRFVATVRVPPRGALSVRTTVGSTPTARAATSPVVAVRLARGA